MSRQKRLILVAIIAFVVIGLVPLLIGCAPEPRTCSEPFHELVAYYLEWGVTPRNASEDVRRTLSFNQGGAMVDSFMSAECVVNFEAIDQLKNEKPYLNWHP